MRAKPATPPAPRIKPTVHILRPKAPKRPRAIGSLGAKDVLGLSPAWQSRFEGYTPKNASMEKLRALAAKRPRLSVEVIFGAWCGDSLLHVPHYVKVQRLIGASKLPSRYVGVDRRKREPEGRGLKYAIRKVPTFVVLEKGREIGRIIETPDRSVEEDLVAILTRR